eukprot:scaffold10350_cov68-Phaeocystis_antarctica.AAC.7
MAGRAACTDLARVSRVRLFSQDQRLRGALRVHTGCGLAVAPRRLAATPHPLEWALSGSVARPEQPAAPQQVAVLKKPDASVAVHPPRHRLRAGVVDGRRRLKHLGRHLLEELRVV